MYTSHHVFEETLQQCQVISGFTTAVKNACLNISACSWCEAINIHKYTAAVCEKGGLHTMYNLARKY